MMQERLGKSGKREQEQNSPNLGTTFLPSPVQCAQEVNFKNESLQQLVTQNAHPNYFMVDAKDASNLHISHSV